MVNADSGFRIPANVKTAFNGNNPVNSFAKFSTSEVWLKFFEKHLMLITQVILLTKNIFNYFVFFLVGDDISKFFKKIVVKQSKFTFLKPYF